MKKLVYLMLAVSLTAACHHLPDFSEQDNQYLVYTTPNPDVDFKKFKTYFIPDSLLVIGLKEDAYYSEGKSAAALINTFKAEMDAAGYTYEPDKEKADLGVQLTYVLFTEYFIQYYYPYFWYEYPGYWGPGYWGDWWMYYYPMPMVGAISTNVLVADLLDLTAPEGEHESLPVVWASVMSGPLTSTLPEDVTRLQESVRQAFVQSPYLKK